MRAAAQVDWGPSRMQVAMSRMQPTSHRPLACGARHLQRPLHRSSCAGRSSAAVARRRRREQGASGAAALALPPYVHRAGSSRGGRGRRAAVRRHRGAGVCRAGAAQPPVATRRTAGAGSQARVTMHPPAPREGHGGSEHACGLRDLPVSAVVARYAQGRLAARCSRTARADAACSCAPGRKNTACGVDVEIERHLTRAAQPAPRAARREMQSPSVRCSAPDRSLPLSLAGFVAEAVRHRGSRRAAALPFSVGMAAAMSRGRASIAMDASASSPAPEDCDLPHPCADQLASAALATLCVLRGICGRDQTRSVCPCAGDCGRGGCADGTALC